MSQYKGADLFKNVCSCAYMNIYMCAFVWAHSQNRFLLAFAYFSLFLNGACFVQIDAKASVPCGSAAFITLVRDIKKVVCFYRLPLHLPLMSLYLVP